MTKTSYHTSDGNVPPPAAIENLKRVCGWLEILRERYNRRYGDRSQETVLTFLSSSRADIGRLRSI
jgi:hypothetical protein